MPVALPEYSTSEVEHISGATQRQLQWWHEHAVIKPRIVGTIRNWSEADTLEVCIASELRSKGFSLRAISRVLQRLRSRRGDAVPDYLLIEGVSPAQSKEQQRTIRQARLQRASVHLEYGRSDAFARIANARGGVFLVDVDALSMRIRDWQRRKEETKRRAAAPAQR